MKKINNLAEKSDKHGPCEFLVPDDLLQAQAKQPAAPPSPPRGRVKGKGQGR